MKRLSSSLRLPPIDVGLLVFAAVLTASLVLNARLALDTKAIAPVFAETGFLVGTRFPDVLVAAPGQPSRPLTFARSTLLYIFSPGCEWSKADALNFTTIAQASAGKYDVLSVYVKPYDSDQDVSNYLARHPLPGRVLSVDLAPAKLSQDVIRRFGSTPQLLVIASGGPIRQAWSGALFGRRQAEAERYFGLTLPGISMDGGVAVVRAR